MLVRGGGQKLSNGAERCGGGVIPEELREKLEPERETQTKSNEEPYKESRERERREREKRYRGSPYGRRRC